MFFFSIIPLFFCKLLLNTGLLEPCALFFIYTNNSDHNHHLPQIKNGIYVACTKKGGRPEAPGLTIIYVQPCLAFCGPAISSWCFPGIHELWQPRSLRTSYFPGQPILRNSIINNRPGLPRIL